MSAVFRETHLDALLLPGNVRKRLNGLGIWYLEDLALVSHHDLLNLNGIGTATMDYIRHALCSVGLQLA